MFDFRRSKRAGWATGLSRFGLDDGIVTQVALLNAQFGLELDGKYFRYDDLNLPGPRGAPER